MKLNEIRDNDYARKNRKRVGRGIGSELETSGKGHKGQKSRSGVVIKGLKVVKCLFIEDCLNMDLIIFLEKIFNYKFRKYSKLNESGKINNKVKLMRTHY